MRFIALLRPKMRFTSGIISPTLGGVTCSLPVKAFGPYEKNSV
jgi:hypothetical protein